jgi:hypothetical protein
MFHKFVMFLRLNNKQVGILIKLLEKTASNGYIPPISFVKALEKKLKE